MQHSWHCSCPTYFCCFLLALANLKTYVDGLSCHSFKLRILWIRNHPQYLSGLSRAIFPRTFLEIAAYPRSPLLVSFFQDPKELCLEKNIRNSKEFITCFCIPIVGLRQTDRYPPTLAEDTDEWPRLINVGTEQNKERKTESRLGAR